MQVERYRIVLTGMTKPGFKTQEVIVELSCLFKIPVDRVRPLLVGEPSVIRRDLTLEKAEHLLSKIERRGAECSLKKVVREENKLRTGSGGGIEQTGILEPDLNMESSQFVLIEDDQKPARLKPGFFSKQESATEQRGLSTRQILLMVTGLLILVGLLLTLF
jgi:hypothetical protein